MVALSLWMGVRYLFFQYLTLAMTPIFVREYSFNMQTPETMAKSLAIVTADIGPAHGTPSRVGQLLRVEGDGRQDRVCFSIPLAWLVRQDVATIVGTYYEGAAANLHAGRIAKLSCFFPLNFPDPSMYLKCRDLIRKAVFEDRNG
jgi:hypothetical protein